MPTRDDLPPMPAKEAAEKIRQKVDAEQTRAVFQQILVTLLVGHFLVVMVLSGLDLTAYVESWKALLLYARDHPLAGAALPASLWALYRGIDMWRHPDPDTLDLPEYPEIPDLRWENAIYIGSAWTRDGKQPGETVDPSDDEILEDPHVIIPEKGLFGNLHVKGGVGGGKTSTLIKPFLDQAINKYPKPPELDRFDLGPDGRYMLEPRDARRRAPADREGGDGEASGRSPLAALRRQMTFDDRDPRRRDIPYRDRWNPYFGMTPEEAEAEYERLMAEHREKKWSAFLIDPKGDLTEFVQRTADVAGRGDDVVVLRPNGEHTYNPLAISHNPLVQAEMVMDGIEAISGQQVQQYYRSTMSEWLANALEILQAVEPTQINFKTILRMARSETLRTRWTAEAEAIMNQVQEREAALKRVGKEYTGPRVNPAAIEFFRDWDDVDADRQRQQAVVSGIKSQSKYFVDDQIAPFLCPEMPPTFDGFDTMIDEGKIVVLRTPLGEYGPVGKVLGILMLADAQQAALERINVPEMNQERVVAFVVDEAAAYMNKQTKEFVAKNRQSRVTFLAAHQSQGQLVQHHDKSYEQSFNDNLRTKVSYNAPNAEAATRDSRIFGSRKVIKEVWTESQNFGQVTREEGSESIKPGHESQGATRRLEEVERNWFNAEDFMALETGECILMQFDGTTTLPPRKIKAPKFWQTERHDVLFSADVDLTLHDPHPIVEVPPGSDTINYLDAALSETGYIILEPLAEEDGHLGGFKVVTDIGTALVDVRALEQHREIIAERLEDPRPLVAFTHFDVCSRFFGGTLGVTFERVIDFGQAWQLAMIEDEDGDEPRGFYELMRAVVDQPPPYPEREGAWEWHRCWEDHDDALIETCRAMMRLHQTLGDRLHEMDESTVEELYHATVARIDDVLIDSVDAEVSDASTPDAAPEAGEPGEARGALDDAADAEGDGRADGGDFDLDTPAPPGEGGGWGAFDEPVAFEEPEAGGEEGGDPSFAVDGEPVDEDPFAAAEYPSELADEADESDGDDPGAADDPSDEGPRYAEETLMMPGFELDDHEASGGGEAPAGDDGARSADGVDDPLTMEADPSIPPSDPPDGSSDPSPDTPADPAADDPASGADRPDGRGVAGADGGDRDADDAGESGDERPAQDAGSDGGAGPPGAGPEANGKDFADGPALD